MGWGGALRGKDGGKTKPCEVRAQYMAPSLVTVMWDIRLWTIYLAFVESILKYIYISKK